MKECTDGKQSHKYINKDQRICQDVVEGGAVIDQPVDAVVQGGHDAYAAACKAPFDGVGVDAAEKLADCQHKDGKGTAHCYDRQFGTDIRHGCRAQERGKHSEPVP